MAEPERCRNRARSLRGGGLLLVAAATGVLAWTSTPASGPRERAGPTVANATSRAHAGSAGLSGAPGRGGGVPVSGPASARQRARSPVPATVRGALRRLRATGVIDQRTYRTRRRVLRRVRASVRRLAGARRTELAAALGAVDDLAARRLLTAGRMRLAFLTLRRNLETWTRGSFPAAGERVRFGRDPAVFQYFPGRGLAFHPLASFGPVNARARLCLERRSRCHPRALRHALDRLAGLAVRRSGFAAWEYLVSFGGGRPPWISAMAQATAIQALARGSKALNVPRWRALADDALGAFERPAPTGVRVNVPGGRYYAMYSFSPSLRILNGSLQALIGLYDHARLSRSARARRLLDAAEPTARATVGAYDTGAWSLYARNGRESPLGYHRLVIGQLKGLCQRLGERAYCDAGRRFARYASTPPRVELAWGGRARAGHATPIAFSLSQPASIHLAVRRAGRTVLRRELLAGPGRHVLAWAPPRSGHYRLTLRATGRAGARSLRRASLVVRTPRATVRKRHRPAGRRRERRTRPKHPHPTPGMTPAPDRAPAPVPSAPSPAAPPAVAPAPGPTTVPEPTATPEATATPGVTPTPEPTATVPASRGDARRVQARASSAASPSPGRSRHRK